MQKGNIYYSFFLFTLLAAMVLPAESATINVSTNASDVLGDNNICALREAITNINNATNTYTDCASVAGSYGTADTINLPAGSYTNSIAVAGSSPNNATGDLYILKSVTINGAGAWRTTIDGGSIDRAISVGNTVTANISGVTIQKGYGGIYNAGTLHLTSSTISSNTANIYFGIGGGISNAGTLYITNSTISGNRAYSGGGIYNGGYTGGTVVITSSTISSNTGDYNVGGIYNGNGSITVYSSTITNNTGGGYVP